MASKGLNIFHKLQGAKSLIHRIKKILTDANRRLTIKEIRGILLKFKLDSYEWANHSEQLCWAFILSAPGPFAALPSLRVTFLPPWLISLSIPVALALELPDASWLAYFLPIIRLGLAGGPRHLLTSLLLLQTRYLLSCWHCRYQVRRPDPSIVPSSAPASASTTVSLLPSSVPRVPGPVDSRFWPPEPKAG